MTTRSIISNIRATPRLFPGPISSPSHQAKLLRLSHHRPEQSKNTRSDRVLVLGLLTFTTLLGIGIGTRAKCFQDEKPRQESKNSSDESSSKNPSENPSQTPSENSEQEGAFNPETGEINWDCPCLGGMAHGTCGEQFKAAFSCFVHSEQEPKGVECIERFKDMQDCFREHPDEYGPELTDSEDSTPDDESANSPDEPPNSPEEPLNSPAEPPNAPAEPLGSPDGIVREDPLQQK
ncbi:hypothetical protein PtB15_6B844 [Puccinia triticina]|nr:hypothetical protein PtB15_6B844 [Puccinia triticina]